MTESEAAARWPWLRPAGAGPDLIEHRCGRVWPQLADRGDLPPDLVALGMRLAGRVAAAGSPGAAAAISRLNEAGRRAMPAG